MTKLRRGFTIGIVAIASLYGGSAMAQDGAALFASKCSRCHDDQNHPLGLVYNTAGNAAVLAAVIAKGMTIIASPEELAAIAAYLDTIKPTISMRHVSHDAVAANLPLDDIIVSAATQHADWRIIDNIVTVSPPAKGTVTYGVKNGFAAPSTAFYTPFSGQSGVDTWTYQGVGVEANTTVRTATVVIANADGSYSTSPDMNQHGLTGSWYELATSGQGIEVEIFPGMNGTGVTQVSWFTYDTTAGGADHQRWYTLAGNVVSGQPSAALTIYRNIGGNFNAVPTTAAQPVGSAILSFDSCTSGQLDYTFSDGSARSGSIALSRLTQNITCTASGTAPTNADYALSGNWYDPSTSGQGITVEINPASSALFLAWYTYANNGAAVGAAGQRWYTAQAVYTTGARSIPITLYETTGGVLDAPTTPPPNTIPVGTGTLAFQGCANATLAFNFTGGSSSGKSGSISLVRVGSVPSGCTS